MTEVKVGKPGAVIPAETAGLAPVDYFAPMFPVGRFFGLSPFAALREFTEGMDRAFHGITPVPQTWAPKVDIHTIAGNLVVKAELPGLKKEEVKVELTSTALIIEGVRTIENTENVEGYHRYETNYGAFYRTIPLPAGAKTDLATAELYNGVLTITIPTPELKKNVRQLEVAVPVIGKKPAV